MEALITIRAQDQPRLSSDELDEGRQRIDLLPHPGPTPEEEAFERLRDRELRHRVALLPAAERGVLIASFGLGGRPELSLRQIARVLRCSKSEVFRIRERALGRLRVLLGPAEEWL